MLCKECAFVFTITYQDRTVAAPRLSSTSTREIALGRAIFPIISVPANFQETKFITKQQQILEYSDEGASNRSDVFGKRVAIPSPIRSTAEDGREHTIKDFLNRPFNLQNFEWVVADNKFTVLQSYELPDVFMNTSLWREKLSGFLGFRADVRCRLQINAQPFQAGRIIMAYIPYYKYLGAYGTYYDAGTEQAMVSLTGCPRVEVDLSITTESEILIPFVSPHSHFNLTTGEGYYGRLIIAVYSPLVDTVGAGKVDCTLWLNLENIDLAFPTGTTTATSSLSPVVQVGKEEVQVEQYRSIAKDVGKVAEFLHAIEDVPVLSTIVKPAAWASDAAASFLKFCGYSKLQSTNTPQFLKQSVTKFMPNYDGVDMSHCLGFEAANAIELMPMVGNDVDEMALAHIVRTPCYFSSFAWSSSQASGTELFDAFVTPNYFKNPITGSPATPSHLTYVSSLFAYWRGSIDFKFKLVKTKFHSGHIS